MIKQALLPERHPNSDFFIADVFDALPIKNDRHTMEHPFFTLSTKADVRTVRYNRGDISITLNPHNEYGLPTMMDKDILLYCSSCIMAEVNKGYIPPKTIRFSAHDLMVTTNRMTNGQAYAQLKQAFERLTGCLITTNIATNGMKHSKGFHMLESFEIIEKSRDQRRMVKLEVTLSDWFYNSLIGKEVLTINRAYFRLRKSLERRLYELARKHCGKQAQWKISINNLHEKSGSRSELKKFRFQIKKIIENNIETNHFPDYIITLENDIITFTNRKSIPQLPLSGNIQAITPETITKARRIVEKAATGWDFTALHAEFSEQILSGKFTPTNINGAFINFVKKKVREAP